MTEEEYLEALQAARDRHDQAVAQANAMLAAAQDAHARQLAAAQSAFRAAVSNANTRWMAE